MASKDLEKEMEIKSCEDITSLKRMKASRKGQVTKAQQELERLSTKSLHDLKTITLETLSNAFEKQAHFSTLIQDRILTLLRPLPETASYDEGEIESEASEALHQTIREGIHELQTALNVANKATRLQNNLDLFQSSESLGDRDMLAKLETMETTINGLLDTQATISDLPELKAQLSTLQLSHRRLIKEVLRITAPRDSISASTEAATSIPPSLSYSAVRLPRMELPTFHGDQEKWRDFWDEFHNALEKDLSLTSIHYLRSSIKNEEGKDIVATGSRGGKDYDTIVPEEQI